MDFTAHEAQVALQKLRECPQLRCVLDQFAQGVTKKSREDIYVFIKESGQFSVEGACILKEQPHRRAKGDVCYRVNFAKKGVIQILWRNEKGRWRLSNASKRPLGAEERD